MEGFYSKEEGLPVQLSIFEGNGMQLLNSVKMTMDRLPIKWACLRHDPLCILLDHSDCDGKIAVSDCIPIAERLEALAEQGKIMDSSTEPWMLRKTRQFAAGLRAAAAANEPVEFH